MDCPSCKNKVVIEDGQPNCKFCGAYARLNPENATVEWMKDGRVFKNEKMEQEAYDLWSSIYPDSFD